MEILLLLHVFGAVVFLGNILTAAFWKTMADIKGDPRLIYNTVKNVMLADFIFTLPGLILIIGSGILMAEEAGYAMSGINWLTLSLVLFAITGVLWLLILLPLQRRMIRHSAQSIEVGTITTAYRKASRYWAIFGITATVLPLVILYFMITKGF